MDKQAFVDLVQKIGTCEDEVQRREMLANMQDEVSAVFDTNETLTTQNTTLTQNNEQLREANMKLFLRVGESKSQAEQFKDGTGLEKPKEKLKFDDLFNDKGGLK